MGCHATKIFSVPLTERRWIQHTPPSWVSDATYFITICCQLRGENQLCTPEAEHILFNSFLRYQDKLRWHVSVCLLMPDHLHALVSIPRDEDLATIIAAWKGFTARDADIVWQNGFFDHRVRSDKSFAEKSYYIHMNPVHKGLVAQPKDWLHVFHSPRQAPLRSVRA
jgi:putative transposase